jgi:maleate isomerase
VRRIGIILPSVNVLMEPEYYKLGIKGIHFHATRVMLTETTPEALKRMEKDLDYAIELISSVKPDVVAYACTSGSFIGGLKWDNDIIKKIQDSLGCPAVTTSSAMIDALKQLNIKRPAVITPYIDTINEMEKKFLEANGFNVVNIKGMQIIDAEELHSKTPDEIYEFALNADRAEADGMFISCTDFRGMEIAEKLEKQLNKPVVTSNQATLWWLLKTLDIKCRIEGQGTLLQNN